MENEPIHMPFCEPANEQDDSDFEKAIRAEARHLQTMKQKWRWKRDWHEMFRGQTWPINIRILKQEETTRHKQMGHGEHLPNPSTGKKNYFTITGFKENGASIFEGHMTRNHTMFASSVTEPTFFSVPSR